MKAEELRIGNLVFDAKGAICKITKLNADKTETQIEAWPINGLPFVHPEFSHIPLTKELLPKLGFDQDENFESDFNFKGCDWFIEIKDGIFTVDNLYTRNEIEYKPIIVDTVHDLQNAWSVLTKIELTLKDE